MRGGQNGHGCGPALAVAARLLKSRWRVRIMIMATMPERKRTIMRELTIENQWICSSPAGREAGSGWCSRGGGGGGVRMRGVELARGDAGGC